MKARYYNSPESAKTIGGIIAINTAVFSLWLLPGPHKGFLSKYFLANPWSKDPKSIVSMLLCNYSHMTFLHFFVNMYALWSFGNVVHSLIGRENFLAFYTTAGLIGSLASHYYFSLIRAPGFSLGASGAIIGLAGLYAYFYPNTQFLLLFVIPVQAKIAAFSLATFDTLGLFGLWRTFCNFDHAAHLGGLASGVAWASYVDPRNRKYVQPLRNKVRKYKEKITQYLK
eukprot:TRINITY_DN1069_c0_g1_i1.p1 TRINITY_DN1069_c0_g1~~TRINITY_DN1069_c0_g1_i1.p1  ORF type:complete len:227 (+),score=26.76 TRINITY_DN1069_c0_g1_i1:71-751(+)